MAIENLTTNLINDCVRVNELYRAIAILDGLDAFAERENDAGDVFMNIQHMSRTAQQIIRDVIDTMKP